MFYSKTMVEPCCLQWASRHGMQLPMPDPAKAEGESNTFTRLLKKAMPDATWETFAGAESRRSLVCTTAPAQCGQLLQQAGAPPGSPCVCFNDHRWVSFISKKTLQRLPLASGQGACEGVLRLTMVLETLGSKGESLIAQVALRGRTETPGDSGAAEVITAGQSRACP